jgi:hypothetical protein
VRRGNLKHAGAIFTGNSLKKHLHRRAPETGAAQARTTETKAARETFFASHAY